MHHLKQEKQDEEFQCLETYDFTQIRYIDQFKGSCLSIGAIRRGNFVWQGESLNFKIFGMNPIQCYNSIGACIEDTR